MKSVRNALRMGSADDTPKSSKKVDVSAAPEDSGRGSSDDAAAVAGSSSRRSVGRNGLYGSLEVTYGLPVLDEPKIQSKAFRSISRETLAIEIKRLGWSAFCEKYILIDCRYPYEYAGGHIKCAINVHDKSQLEPHFFSPVHERVPIFHCEFSQKRGPAMAHALREFDRRANLDRFVRGDPSVHYQEIYLLEGGYKRFFEQFQEHGLCEPNAYVAMLSDKSQLARYTSHLKRPEQAAPKSRLRAMGRKIRGIAMKPLRFSKSPSPVDAKRMKPTTPAGPPETTVARKSNDKTPSGPMGFMRPLTDWYPMRKHARASLEALRKTPVSGHKSDPSEGHMTTPKGVLKRRISKPIVEHPVTSDDEQPHEASDPLPAMGRLSFKLPTSSDRKNAYSMVDLSLSSSMQ